MRREKVTINGTQIRGTKRCSQSERNVNLHSVETYSVPYTPTVDNDWYLSVNHLFLVEARHSSTRCRLQTMAANKGELQLTTVACSSGW
jgi:hypothetical protein